MAIKLNRHAYERLIQEDLTWLMSQPRTLERDHIEAIINRSVAHEYPRPRFEDAAAAREDEFRKPIEASIDATPLVERLRRELAFYFGAHHGELNHRLDSVSCMENDCVRVRNLIYEPVAAPPSTLSEGEAEMRIRAAAAEMYDLLPLDVYERVVKRIAAALQSVPVMPQGDVWLQAIRALEHARDEWDAKGRKHYYSQIAQECIGVLRAAAAKSAESVPVTKEK